MFDLDEEDMYIPNTKVIRDLLVSLNYKITPIDPRVKRHPLYYKAICFSAWITQFDQIKQTNKLLYCMDEPNLTEEQSIFVFNILHVCTDYATFKEALQQYINKPLE